MQGFTFQAPNTEAGELSPYGVLEMLWVAPAILKGIQQSVWSADHPNDHLKQMWVKLGLLTTDGQLSDIGNKFVELESLFEYEIGMINQQLSGEFDTKPEKYAALRQGLKNYSDLYLEMFVDELAAAIPANGTMIDLAGGAAALTTRILAKRPDVKAIVVDRELAFEETERMEFHECDIFSNDDWGRVSPQVDLILCSEFLHCCDKPHRIKVYDQMAEAVKDKAAIAIVEQYPNFRLEWRLRDMSSKNGHCVNPQGLLCEIIDNFPMNTRLDKVADTSTHYVMMVSVRRDTDN